MWSPDGARIASSSEESTTAIWDPSTGDLLATRRQPSQVMSVSWSRDGTRLLTTPIDGILRIWDAHRDTHSIGEVTDFVARHAPFRLAGTRLEPAISVTGS